jgi:hypothetical protein
VVGRDFHGLFYDHGSSICRNTGPVQGASAAGAYG